MDLKTSGIIGSWTNVRVFRLSCRQRDPTPPPLSSVKQGRVHRTSTHSIPRPGQQSACGQSTLRFARPASVRTDKGGPPECLREESLPQKARAAHPNRGSATNAPSAQSPREHRHYPLPSGPCASEWKSDQAVAPAQVESNNQAPAFPRGRRAGRECRAASSQESPRPRGDPRSCREHPEPGLPRPRPDRPSHRARKIHFQPEHFPSHVRKWVAEGVPVVKDAAPRG